MGPAVKRPLTDLEYVIDQIHKRQAVLEMAQRNNEETVIARQRAYLDDLLDQYLELTTNPGSTLRTPAP